MDKCGVLDFFSDFNASSDGSVTVMRKKKMNLFVQSSKFSSVFALLRPEFDGQLREDLSIEEQRKIKGKRRLSRKIDARIGRSY